MSDYDKKIQYNKNQAKQYEWTPEWFGATDFDERLVKNIIAFQIENGLSGDGMCGPATFRRLWTIRQEDDEALHTLPDQGYSNRVIVHNGTAHEILWDKVRLWSDEGGLTTKDGCYSSYAGKKDRDPSFFVTHWDVCLSAKSCASVLRKRGISVHFCIDNDGTIYQLLDTQHAAWHAGGRNWNHTSIGVEVSDAYSLKYQDWYERKGFGPRPIWKDAKVHGKTLKPFLGFYDVQVEALAALWEATSRACDIPLELPTELYGVDARTAAKDFKGYCCHFNLTNRKIDCAGLDMPMVLAKALEIRKKYEGG